MLCFIARVFPAIAPLLTVVAHDQRWPGVVTGISMHF